MKIEFLEQHLNKKPGPEEVIAPEQENKNPREEPINRLRLRALIEFSALLVGMILVFSVGFPGFPRPPGQ